MPETRIVLLGPPGVGKGTQAKLLSLSRGVPAIATGDMLRAAAQSGSDLGRRAQEYMVRGDLVPDEVIISVMEERLCLPNGDAGFLLDGFPRTVPQAEALDRILDNKGKTLTAVISLIALEEVIVQRISGRLMCSNCASVFHRELNPPAESGVCDVCQGRIVVREDDKPEAVRRRLKVYAEKTAPLLDYYREQRVLREVDASADADTVHTALEAALKR
ncbi:MAG: adenylate kinase [Armatimonadetes bacterium]|nr:adenylate kinase [Armatimonadota bacterium]